jgi:hypothetical protein
MFEEYFPRISRLAVLIFLVLFFLPASCGNVPPTSPEPGSQRSEIDIVGINVPGGLTLQGSLKAKEKIGPEGGTVEIPGFLRVVIPAGAMDKEKDIKIEIPHLEKFEWKLDPKYEFNVPVELTVFLANADLDTVDGQGWPVTIDPDSLEVYWKNTCDWIPQGAVYNESENALEVALPHFSRYALAVD